ncbi:MAG: acyltransferase [Bacteroidetes bacterium]|nr:MAG: acyltransferase [Bacteroidota bacterium]PTM12602.1 MAG: acyltransferase [Bacteroidota bacterium]
MKRLLAAQLQQIQTEGGWSSRHPLVYLLLVWRLAGLGWRWLTARWALRGAPQLGKLVFAKGRLQVQLRGALHVGERVRFWSTIVPTQLRVYRGATLVIGDDCFINGSLLVAHQSITIGRGVYLAPMAQIADSYAFGMATASVAASTAPICIGDQAWIATRAIILPGVSVGRGAVVGVGAVVDTDVPDYAVVAGVPAKIIRFLEDQARDATAGLAEKITAQ